MSPAELNWVVLDCKKPTSLRSQLIHQLHEDEQILQIFEITSLNSHFPGL